MGQWPCLSGSRVRTYALRAMSNQVLGGSAAAIAHADGRYGRADRRAPMHRMRHRTVRLRQVGAWLAGCAGDVTDDAHRSVLGALCGARGVACAALALSRTICAARYILGNGLCIDGVGAVIGWRGEASRWRASGAGRGNFGRRALGREVSK